MSTRNGITPLLVGAALLAGCASTPMPSEQLAAGKTAIDAAQNAGAGQYAASELNSARAKLDQATATAKDGKYKEARRLAEEATVEAQLAQAHATAARQAHAAHQVNEANQALQSELDRNAAQADQADQAGQANQPQP